ncbi:glycerate kinase type-2 family protein [Halosimplex amylolyticum]|uniref:glycerate kinase type-2 family protein n=1 Tax=Halosimplex amylolyticum TaxID=3396616 RepID=UPI003F57C769
MIRGRSKLENSDEHALALDCVEESIRAAAPETATRSAVTLDGETLMIQGTEFNLTEYDDVLIVGGGKAAGGVTRTLESILDDRITGGLVVSKTPVETIYVEIVVGDHPVPSATNVEATDALLELVDAADERTLVLFVLTGGASSLLASPAGDLTLADLQTTTERLLEGGVPIDEVNTVRKHCSAVKGGRLAHRATPADMAGVVLSDVVGNDLSTIGSGPSVPDETTFADASAIFDQYDIDPPGAVADHLAAGADGNAEETPFPGDPALDGVENVLIGDNATALDAARSVAEDAGYEPLLLSSRLRGEAREVAKTVIAVGEEISATGEPVEPPTVVLGGGETTVTVTDTGGSGGPNQELVLSSALELDGPGIIAAVDTDGEDGSSDAAGAIADATTVTDVGVARDHLARNDAGTYLAETGVTIETGSTGTNVNDVIVLVVPDDVD